MHRFIARSSYLGKTDHSQFFEAFKDFEGRAFHMAGESYGVSRPRVRAPRLTDCQGRYIPLFASAVFDGNKALVAEGKTPINLQSVMIGNGITDLYKTTDSYFPFVLHASFQNKYAL